MQSLKAFSLKLSTFKTLALQFNLDFEIPITSHYSLVFCLTKQTFKWNSNPNPSKEVQHQFVARVGKPGVKGHYYASCFIQNEQQLLRALWHKSSSAGCTQLCNTINSKALMRILCLQTWQAANVCETKVEAGKIKVDTCRTCAEHEVRRWNSGQPRKPP